jgi:serine/threonine protein kinase
LKHEYAILQQLKQVEGVVKAQQLLEFESHELLIMPDNHSVSLDRWLDQTYSESHSQQSSSLVKYVSASQEGLRHKRRQMDLAEFFSIANQLCRTLFELQKSQIVHCDINPSNILIELKTGKVQLIDFGLALNGSDLREGGTLDYLAPEQAGRTGKRVDHRSDLYALGASLFDLLCGVTVFECSERMELVHSHLAKKPRRVDQLRADIPVDLANLIDKLLCKQKQDRYQSAFGVLCDLEIIQQRLNSASSSAAGIGDISYSDELKLAEQDFSDEFIVSNKLYGCQSELELLDGALNQVEKASKTNQPQSHVVIINGPSGCGKSFIVDHV